MKTGSSNMREGFVILHSSVLTATQSPITKRKDNVILYASNAYSPFIKKGTNTNICNSMDQFQNIISSKRRQP